MLVFYISHPHLVQNAFAHHTRDCRKEVVSVLFYLMFICPISKSLSSHDYSCLFYSDDIVVFSVNKYVNCGIFLLNSALNSLNNKLSSAFFEVGPDKSQLMDLY